MMMHTDVEEAAQVGKTHGLWLSETDFISTAASKAEEFGPIGFPRDWPGVYSQSQVLKALIGKRGTCAGERTAVVGLPQESELEQVKGLQLRRIQSFANAEDIEQATGLQRIYGWAVFEQLDEPAGSAFVAERFWWNALPDGKWVDFTPRPPCWPQLLLVAASTGAGKAKSTLTAADAELARKLLRQRFGDQRAPVAAGPRIGQGSDVARLQEELARVTKEADDACAEMRRWEAQVVSLEQQLDPATQRVRWNTSSTASSVKPGALVRIHGLRGDDDLNDQEATAISWDSKRGRWRVQLPTGELRAVLAESLELVDEAKEQPDLTTFGCEVVGHLPAEVGNLRYHLWPLIYSGFVRVRVPEKLLARLNAQVDGLSAERATPSHAPFLQAEMRQGKQLTVRSPDEEYTALLLACAEKLAVAIAGAEEVQDWRFALDQVWTVHQLAGDYNPVHFHTNARSHFGFSSFLHLQLPPHLNTEQQRRPLTGSTGRHAGVTSFIWKTDSGMARENLECPGVLECELVEGYLYVFPQWVQHFVWPFQGPGERRTLAANVSLLSGKELVSDGKEDPGDPRRAVRASRYK